MTKKNTISTNFINETIHSERERETERTERDREPQRDTERHRERTYIVSGSAYGKNSVGIAGPPPG